MNLFTMIRIATQERRKIEREEQARLTLIAKQVDRAKWLYCASDDLKQKALALVKS